MDTHKATNLIKQYVEGWKAAQIDDVLNTLAEDCVVTESYGPIYRGRDKVRVWIEKWLGEDNRVLQWDIHSFVHGQDSAAFEWSFKCLWHGSEFNFEGASVVQFKNGKIWYMREYATTAQLYEWEGIWKE
jgi:ketosteroid isomerase-like protein